MSLKSRNTQPKQIQQSFSIVSINKENVLPIPIPLIDVEKIKGYKLFPEVYANIFLCARKKSGKTSAIFKILKACVDKDTEINIFASTLNKDPNWKHIIKYFKRKGNNVETSLGIKEEKTDYLKGIIDQLNINEDGNSSDSDEDEKKKKKYISVNGDSDDEKVRKKRLLAPEYIFVLDDLGAALKNPSVAQLLKTNRHYKCKVIISSQYPHDLTPEARRQLDYLILFGGHQIEKLQVMFEDADLPISFELFSKLYKDATKDKYNFLYVNVRDVLFRKNFNKSYQLS